MTRPLPALALLAACSPGGSFSGRVVDGFTQEPRADIRVLAKSSDTTDLTCKVREATTDAAGNFTLDQLCANATYALALADDTLMLGQSKTLTSEDVAGPSPEEVVSWRAPTGSGLYQLAGDTLSSLRSFSDVATETILDSEDTVRYPTMKPTRVEAIAEGEILVLSGADTIARVQIHPLVPDTGKRRFAGDVSIEDHVYIGVKFNSDTDWEAQEAALDASKVQKVDNGERQVQYVPAAALPPGRYAILGEKDKRTFVLDFGAGPPAAAPPAE